VTSTTAVPTARLADTVETTVLGFGCADLFRVPDARRRRILLETALDAGIRHFDVAPMYGLGRVERELGRFARGRRDRIVIATKFGIEPRPAGRVLAPLQSQIHRMLASLPRDRGGSRSVQADPRAGVVGGALYRRGYDGETARANLERSLRALGTDHVDILFLHDPYPDDVRSDDVRAYLETARASGRIRTWGVAGEPASAAAAADVLGAPVPVMQVRRDIFTAAHDGVAREPAQSTILFGVLGRALSQILARTRDDPAWRDVDRGPDAIASLLLRDALRANPSGTVLFSTTHPERIRPAVAAAERDEHADADLDALRALVRGGAGS